ncbi:histone lysine methyltransferase Set9 [Coniothyrium glycines]
MPPHKGEKKGLTLEKLAAYDDVITDALVDKVYYWTAIRKNRGGRFTGMRGLHEEDIADIIREHVIWAKDSAAAVSKLLQLPGLRKYMTSLKSEGDKEQFKRHLRRYVHIYMPDCPFEVTTTNRYTITDHEASVTARRDINPREEIRYLTGVQVAMTEQQEKSLELARKDFSLVYSSRKKTRSLFLGPARFANHDCDPNAKLATKGYEGMQIVAVKPIDEGEEITVSYGNDYFGDDNEECLCHTCEVRQQNGWAPMRRVEHSDEEVDEQEMDEPTEDSSSRKRQHEESTPEIAPNPATKRVRLQQTTPPVNRHVSDPLREHTLKKAHSESSLRHEIPVSSIEDPSLNPNPSLAIFRAMRTQQREGLLTTHLDETSSSREATPLSPTAASPKSSEATDTTSVDDEPHLESINLKVKVDPESILSSPTLGIATVKEEVTTTTIVKRKPRPTLRTTRSKSRFDVQNRVGTPITIASDADSAYEENKRKPGDYMTSSSLLSAKYSKWVECQTCDTSFVQQDGYNTRKECPRCERHSKLYGFPWPKTEKEGKHDKEERVKDHRTVHRFVDPDEERVLKKCKAKKVLREGIRERYSTPRSSGEMRTASVEGSGRRRRVRKTM